MSMYVRQTRSVDFDELPERMRTKLTEHAESRQIRLVDLRLWLTHSENPPASSGLGKLLRRRANPTDPEPQHDTVVVLHPTQVLVITDRVKHGTTVLSLPLAQASVASGTGFGARLDAVAGDTAGFTITGFPGEQVGSLYIGLGPEPAAAECLSAVRDAISTAKNP